jgi:NAD(P)-dependent dehydrogenase (short-subunit alcohol dehydrogenase family)
MNMKLKDKTIVISGGTKGVGRHLVEKMLIEGANVVIGGRDFSIINNSDVINSNKQKTLFVKVNLENVTDCKNMFDEAISKFRKIDGFINYAGVTPVASLTECDESTYDYIMDINTKSAFFCCQHAINAMKQNGGGSIILVGSAHSWSGEKDRAPYSISKGALYTLSEHISHNYSKEKIRCNHIAIGWTATEGELELRKTQGVDKETLEKTAAEIIPMGRMLTYDDYTLGFIYLLSDDASMVTGTNLRITGGQYIS